MMARERHELARGVAAAVPTGRRAIASFRAAAFLSAAALIAAASPLHAQVSVLTYHNDNARTGLNAQETILSLDNVDPAHFGKKFSHRVDGEVYAQPLYVPAVPIPGRGVHNVVYVATEHNSVYAFDADSKAGAGSVPLWKKSFRSKAAGIRPMRSDEVQCDDLVPEIGITSTPVIDAASMTIYVLVKSREPGRFVQRLHALDLGGGEDRPGSPVEIAASMPGGGDGSVDGLIAFDPFTQHQRAGLLLTGGVVYIAWASHCDHDPYHGWLIGYDAATLERVAAFNATPEGGRGGIWQSGGAPAADASGHIYVATGNGTFDADKRGSNFGDSILKIDTSGGSLALADYFTPYNQADLEARDLDLGSSGPMLLPDQPGAHPHLTVVGSKEGTLYLLDRDDMGHFHSGDDSQIVQSVRKWFGQVYGTPAYWNGRIYVQAARDYLQAFSLTDGRLSEAPESMASVVSGRYDFPGATVSISSNGDTNGIAWALQTDAYRRRGRTVLHAYDATDLSLEIYNSMQVPRRDRAGRAVKFTVPTIANGQVYVGAGKRLHVYGLLGTN